MSRQIYNVKTLRNKNYHLLDLGDPWRDLFGKPEAKFVMMVYGPSGSGKSVLVLRFCNMLAHRFGKVLYNSHEEGTNKTIQDRIENFDIDAPKLYIGDKLPFEEMVEKIRRNYYRFVVIDSVQYMAFTYDQLKTLRKEFKRRNLSVVLVSFGKTKHNPQSATDLLHASDIKCFVKDGIAEVESRYLSAPTKTQLFRKSGQLQNHLPL